jgi:hypothetical protein
MKSLIKAGLSFILFSMVCAGLYFLFQNENVYHKSLGKISKNWVNEHGNILLKDTQFVAFSAEEYIQWDAKHYRNIAENSYDVKKSGGDYIYAFFPLLPFLMNQFALSGVGLLVFLLFLFLSGLLLLYKLIPQAKTKMPFYLVFSLPVLVIFSIPYTEALYFFLVSVAILGLLKRNIPVYALAIVFASMTRPSASILLVALVCTEIYFLWFHRNIRHFLKELSWKTLPILGGTAIVSFIQYRTGSGSWFKFLEVQKYWDNKLGLPSGLRDWSHEGFAMHVAILVLLFIPLFIWFVKILKHDFHLSKTYSIEVVKRAMFQQLELLSALYVFGNILFILLFRDGSLHCMFRFALCNPFFFYLFFRSWKRIQSISLIRKRNWAIALSLATIVALWTIPYSMKWNFSDIGGVLMIIAFNLWLFQEFKTHKIYRLALLSGIALNALWLAYMFNMYLSSGWIYA